ncbi:MAG TPA: hypothetical protein VEF53_19015 [Patescibacteria group bacterium]|nr:hypothetical protein [Patescibacteria group bacterium]
MVLSNFQKSLLNKESYAAWNVKLGDMLEALENGTAQNTADLAESTSLIQQNYKLVNVDPNEAISVPSQTKLNIETYTEGTDEIVHPSILFFPNKWNGYKYWLGYTCFDNKDAKLENPCIAVSNDNVNWTVPEGLVNPIEPAPAGLEYLADINLFMSPDEKTMYMVFKETAGTQRQTWLRSSTNGVNWTPKVLLFQNTFEDVSPAVLWDGTQYVMWTVKHADTPNNIYMRTAPKAEGPWSEPLLCTYVLPEGQEPWHMDVRKLGNQYHMLLQTTATEPLYFGVSNNGIDWTFGKKPLFLRGTVPSTLNYGYYKSTIFPMLTDDGLKYGLWYGTAEPYYICYTELTFDRTKLLIDGNNNVAQASLGISPWVFCDTFNRADTTEGLGTSTTGQAWSSVLGDPMGISSNKAYLSTSNNSRSVVDIGISNFYFEGTVSTLGNTSAYLLFRYVDANNLWRLGHGETSGVLQKIVGGTLTDFALPYQVKAGYRLGVECNGDIVRIYINGKMCFELTDDDNNTGTKVGINLNNTTARLDNLIARSIL